MNLREVLDVPHAALIIAGASLRCVVYGDFRAVPVLWRAFGRMVGAAVASDRRRARRIVEETEQRLGW